LKDLRPEATYFSYCDSNEVEIGAKTKRSIAKMQRVDDETAALAPSTVTSENMTQQLIDWTMGL
jgi:hypothetical protein